MQKRDPMGWATHACETLRRGETVTLRPRGNSMAGRVNDGDRVTVAPCNPSALRVGDVVLVRVHGHEYLHLIKAIQGSRYLIGNTRGGINGWVGQHAIFGIATAVESLK
jgi:phage repressor protein C with HTH and peptisase S24 domain